MGMMYKSDYLAHYGIEGMKWGVRRFQNKDGSLTAEGRKRYLKRLEPTFLKTENRVRKFLSNVAKPIVKKDIDLDAVKQRGNLNDAEARRCAQLANAIYDKSVIIEPKITKDITDATSQAGGKMFGLQNRLKQPTSLAAKIGSDAKEDGVSFTAAADQIKDAIRYTSVLKDDDFVSSYHEIKSYLESLGYREERCKNYFDLYKKKEVRHKAVQCVFVDRNGNPFEFQFHTLSSQSAKELKIPIYEERRKAGLSDKRKDELDRQMWDLAEYVPYPKDIFEIKSHG